MAPNLLTQNQHVLSYKPEWDDGETMYFRATAWGTLAEAATETLRKADPVLATGRLTIRTYQRKDGTTGTSNEINLDQIGKNLRYALTNNGSNNSGSTSYHGTYNAPQGGSTGDPWAYNGDTTNATPPF